MKKTLLFASLTAGWLLQPALLVGGLEDKSSSEKEKEEEKKLIESIRSADKDNLAQIIENYPYVIKGSNGRPINKKATAVDINLILFQQKYLLPQIIKGKLRSLTETYGIRAKVEELLNGKSSSSSEQSISKEEAEADLKKAILSANKSNLAQIIQDYPYEILGSKGNPIDRKQIIENVQYLFNKDKLSQFVINGMISEITNTYEIRNKVKELLNIKDESESSSSSSSKSTKLTKEEEKAEDKPSEVPSNQTEKSSSASNSSSSHNPSVSVMEVRESASPVRIEKSHNVVINTYPNSIHTPKKGEEFTIGDIHANPIVFLQFLIRQGVAKILQKDFESLSKIYHDYGSSGKKDEKENQLKEFKSILNRIHFNTNARVRLIGDETADRGKNDLFILFIEKTLVDAGVQLEVLISNHGVEFIRAYESNGNLNPAINFQQMKSIFGIYNIIEGGTENEKDELQELIKNHKKSLKLIGYTLSKEESEITIYSHAAIDINTLEHFSKKYNLIFNKETAKTLAESIDRINIFIKNHVNNNTLNKLCNEKFLNEDVTIEHPFEFVLWNRKYEEQGAINREHSINDYRLNYVHGHDSGGQENEYIFNLDNDFGKKSEPNDKGLYKILVSFGHQLTPKANRRGGPLPTPPGRPNNGRALPPTPPHKK